MNRENKKIKKKTEKKTTGKEDNFILRCGLKLPSEEFTIKTLVKKPSISPIDMFYESVKEFARINNLPIPKNFEMAKYLFLKAFMCEAEMVIQEISLNILAFDDDKYEYTIKVDRNLENIKKGGLL